MPIDINGSGTITGLSVGGLNDGVITPSELSTGAPTWDSQGNVGNITSINSGPLAGFRNAIINGNFDVWQRGTSLSSSGYLADRWQPRSIVNTGGSLVQSQQPFTLGQVEVPGNPRYYWRFVHTSATSVPFAMQQIEDVSTFSGQTVTASFWARRSVASSTCRLDLVQYFGTGGSPSAEVVTQSNTFTIGTSWTYITTTLVLPSVSGKTLGSDGNHYLSFRLNFGGTGSFTFELAQVQLEPGPVATPFERRPIGTELALCQRYYETGFAFFIGYQAVGSAMGYRVPFAVTKRSVPTVAATNVNAGSNLNATPIIGGGDPVTTDSFSLYHTVTTNTASTWRNTWTADAEL